MHSVYLYFQKTLFNFKKVLLNVKEWSTGIFFLFQKLFCLGKFAIIYLTRKPMIVSIILSIDEALRVIRIWKNQVKNRKRQKGTWRRRI